MRYKIGIILLIVTIWSCNLDRNKNNKIKISKRDRILTIKDSIGFISLPYIAEFNPTNKSTYRITGVDSIFRKDFSRLGDVYLVGFLPDTTKYYCILFTGVAAVGNPGLITFDKKGNKISSELITEENCLIYVGDILFCKEYSLINPDMTLEYEYRSIVVQEKSDLTSDTIYTHLKRFGEINEQGKIILGKIDTLNYAD